MKRLLIGFLCLILSFAHADNLDSILEKISISGNLRADFVQEKKINYLNKPMISSGQFFYNQGKGILWKMQKPVVADIIVTDKKIIQKTHHSQSQIQLKNSPYASISLLTEQLMSGNKQALTDTFMVNNVNYSGGNWQLTLIPKDNDLRALFSKIHISGQDFINRIEIEDNHQSSTLIQLKNHQSKFLMDVENELFKMAQ